jgi:hypothetical protein
MHASSCVHADAERTMAELPDRNTDAGLEVRLLLAESPGPSRKDYNLADARICMQWMHIVLWNRVANPKPFGAKEGKLKAVVTAKGQFAGFENYPEYSGGIRQNLQDMLNIANNPKDKRAATYEAHINAAIAVAQPVSFNDPSPGKLVGWRTAGASAPGGLMLLHGTKGGLDFYYMK